MGSRFRRNFCQLYRRREEVVHPCTQSPRISNLLLPPGWHPLSSIRPALDFPHLKWYGKVLKKQAKLFLLSQRIEKWVEYITTGNQVWVLGSVAILFIFATINVFKILFSSRQCRDKSKSIFVVLVFFSQLVIMNSKLQVLQTGLKGLCNGSALR